VLSSIFLNLEGQGKVLFKAILTPQAIQLATVMHITRLETIAVPFTSLDGPDQVSFIDMCDFQIHFPCNCLNIPEFHDIGSTFECKSEPTAKS